MPSLFPCYLCCCTQLGSGRIMQFLQGTQAVRTTAPVVAFDHTSPYALWFLIALLSWPTDKRQQAYALATYAAQLIAYFEEKGPALAAETFATTVAGVAERLGISEEEVLSMPQARPMAEAMLQDASNARGMIEAELLRPAGGYQTLADAPGSRVLREEAQKALSGGARNVGWALLLIANMDRRHSGLQPSLNRAIAIMEATCSGKNWASVSDRTLKDHWKQWRGIAPLSAAIWVWQMDPQAGNTWDERLYTAFGTELGVKSVLRWAKWFRGFAVSFGASKGRGPLIPEEEAVIYDVPLPSAEPPLLGLSPSELEAARRYRAATLKAPY